MLKHESEEPTVSSASQARVTPEELNAALKALDADKQRAAQSQAGTVPIGEVVNELGLDTTPEQIWEQVQRHRAQNVPPPVEAQRVVVAKKAATRRLLRGWREMRGWIWIVFWCSGGLGWFTLMPLIHHNAIVVAPSGQRITISGDAVTEEVNVDDKDVVISGDGDKIILHGKARSLTVDGDNDTIIADTADTALVSGDGDTVKWTGTPPSSLSDPSHRERLPVKGTR